MIYNQEFIKFLPLNFKYLVKASFYRSNITLVVDWGYSSIVGEYPKGEVFQVLGIFVSFYGIFLYRLFDKLQGTVFII